MTRPTVLSTNSQSKEHTWSYGINRESIPIIFDDITVMAKGNPLPPNNQKLHGGQQPAGSDQYLALWRSPELPPKFGYQNHTT